MLELSNISVKIPLPLLRGREEGRQSQTTERDYAVPLSKETKEVLVIKCIGTTGKGHFSPTGASRNICYTSAMEQQTTTTTKITTAIILVVAVIVFGVAMLAIFSSPIKHASDETATTEITD